MTLFTTVTSEQSIVVRISLTPGPSGTMTDMASLALLEDRLIAAIGDAKAGEFDGNEFAESDVFFYAYGPDANRLLAAIRPVLETFPIRPLQVLLRYGPSDDQTAPSTVVTI